MEAESVLPEVPYPGIEPYAYAERNIFFGRDAEARRLCRLVVLYRGVLLYSDSGNGKSSLINAGLIPLAMQEGYRPQKIRVQPKKGQEFVIERPSEEATGHQHSLPPLPPLGQATQRTTLSVERFLELLQQEAATAHPLLVFDQFEEWVTLFEEDSVEQKIGEARAIQEGICKAIVSLLNHSTLPVKVLISLREDYLAKLTPFFTLCPNLPDQYLRLVPLSGDRVYQVIRGPFDRYPGKYAREISPNLAKEIQTQFENRGGGAPVRLTEIQIVCRKLFASSKEGEELEEYFTQQKGVQGILEQYLEQALESLEAQQREPAVCLLTRMVTSAGTRMVIPEEDLLGRVEREDGIPRELLSKTLASLEQNAKLVQREARRDVNYCEIASEFLVGWIRRKAQEHRLQAEQSKLEQQRRTKRRRLAVRVSVGFVLLLAVAVGSFYKIRAIRRHHEEESRRLASEATKILRYDPGMSLMLARLAAAETYSEYKFVTREAEVVLRQALQPGGAPKGSTPMQLESSARELVLSDDGKRLASLSLDNTVRVWDLDSPSKPVFKGQRSRATGVAINSDGSHVAIQCSDQTTQVWDVSSGNTLFTVSTNSNRLREFLFSKKATDLQVDDLPARLKVRNTTSGQVFTLRPKSGAVRPLAVSRDGQRLATINASGMLQIWDTVSGAELWTDKDNRDVVQAAAFSSDGKWLAKVTRFGSVVICDVAARRVVDRLAARWPELRALAISSDGTRLAMDLDRKVSIWALTRQQTRLASAAFSADGLRFAKANHDGTVKVSDASSETEIWTLSGQTNVLLVALSRNGRYLEVASRDGTMKVWDSSVAPGEAVEVHSSLGSPVAFSPDGTRLATVDKLDGKVNVWDTSPGQKVHHIVSIHEVAKLAAFSPDNQRLFTAGDDSVAVWDASSGEKKTSIAVRDLSGAIFSPDAKRLATASHRGPTKLWDDSLTELRTLSNSAAQVLAFSRDGTRLAAADENATLVWDSSSGQLLDTLPATGGRVLAMTFDAAGRLATVTEDGKLHIDVLSVEDLMAVARTESNPSLTPDVCKRILLNERRCAALDSIANARSLAEKGQLEDALADLRKAKRLDSALLLVYDPEPEVKGRVARVRIKEGQSLVERNDFLGATQKFQEAKSLDPSLQIDPNTEPQRLKAQALVKEAGKIARAGDVDDAVKKFQEALSVDRHLLIDPLTAANAEAARGRVDKGIGFALKGNIKDALTAFRDAQKLDPKQIDGESWNALCWDGSLWGHADQVLRAACNEALRLEPGNPHFMDSRGLARALSGKVHWPAAIEDFQAYVDQAEDPEPKSQRQDWIAALRKGKNPFSPDVLKSLRSQEGIEIETEK
jgi:WD40 repeat protein/tetratricopeptide (TPR) repeat protein